MQCDQPACRAELVPIDEGMTPEAIAPMREAIAARHLTHVCPACERMYNLDLSLTLKTLEHRITPASE